MFLHVTEMVESDTGFNACPEMSNFAVVSHNYLYALESLNLVLDSLILYLTSL